MVPVFIFFPPQRFIHGKISVEHIWDKQGREVTDKILEFINDKEGGTPVNIYQQPMDMELIRSMGMIPCGYHRYYFSAEEMLEHSLKDFKLHATRTVQKQKEYWMSFWYLMNGICPSLQRSLQSAKKKGFSARTVLFNI